MQKTQAQNTICPAQIRIGTRASKLAVAQATEVKNRLLGAFPALTQEQIEIVKIMTTGDRIQDKSLAEIGGKGLFTKEIEESLAEGRIDIAVHSMKDMPAELPDDMRIDCVLEREDPRDAFLSHKAGTFMELPEGAIIGTSSVRRQAQILSHRPDFKIVQFRGNVLTRLEKLERGEVDATFLAVAGLKRLNLEDSITSYVEPKLMLPAVAQGAIGIETHSSNEHIGGVLKAINHEKTAIRVSAERAFLKGMGGSCTTPMGCLAEFEEGGLKVRAMLAATDGSKVYEAERKGEMAEAKNMGEELAQELKSKGGEILDWAVAQ